jgi:DNA repair exonuclease SbcCD ATPase subunit
LKQEERQRSEAERSLLGARQEQLQRLLAFRRKRAGIPFEKRTVAALAELREAYETPQAVRREVDRLEARLREGHWETDDNVLGLRDKLADDHLALKTDLERRGAHAERARKSTEEARGAYLSVLRATLRQYARNLRHLAELAGIGVEVDLPEFGRDDLALAQSGLIVRFEFDKKGWIGMDDGEASGGQQVMKSLLLLVALMRDEHRPGGFVFIDEPFAHLDIFNIDKVSAFLKATRAQYVLTTPVTHNINVFQPSELTLVTSKRRPGSPWAQPVAVLRRADEGEAAA